MKKAAAQPIGQLKPFVVTASHDAVLQAVYRYQLLTCVQLLKALSYSQNSLAGMQRLVKKLTDNGYLLAIAHPVTRGKPPLVYTLARKGLNYLYAQEFDVKEYFRPSKEQEKSYLFLQHTLSLNDILIAASQIHKYTSDYSLSSFTHERILKKTPYKVKVWRGEKLEWVTLIPDAYMLFVKHKKKEDKTIPTLWELDRNTVEQKHFRRNFRARIEFIKEEGYKSLLGTPTVTFAYAVAQGGVKRRNEILAWQRKELAATKEKRWLANLFLVCALQKDIDAKRLFLEPCWYTPFEDKKPVSIFDKIL